MRYQHAGAGIGGAVTEGPQVERRTGAARHARRGKHVVALAGVEFGHADPVAARERGRVGFAIDGNGELVALVPGQPLEDVPLVTPFAGAIPG